MLRRLYAGIMIRVGMTVGALICEPQLRLGRRRHDGTCDNCGDPIGRYAMERLDFPAEEYDSTLEHMQLMTRAEYERLCLECATDRGY